MGKRNTPGLWLRPDGRWRVRARIRVGGVNVQRQTIVAGTKEEARDVWAKLKTEIRSGAAPCSLKAADIRTYGDLVALYLSKHLDLSASQREKWEAHKLEYGAIRLSVFADRFEQCIKNLESKPVLRATGDFDKEGQLVMALRKRSGASINRRVELVRAAFRLAVRLALVKDNPITADRFPRRKEKPRNPELTEPERLRLINAIVVTAPYLLPFIQYSLAVPARKTELTKLPRTAYNPFTNTLFVPDSKAEIPINKPVPPEMVQYFRSVPAESPWLFYRVVGGTKRHPKVEYRPLGDFKKAWGSCLRAAGLKCAGPKKIRIHDLRHLSASDLYEGGNLERQIMDIAGWKTPMLSVYWHKDSQRSAQSIQFQAKCANICANTAPDQAQDG